MSQELFQAIEQIGREKGIDVNIIIEAVQEAYVAASRKVFKTKEELGSRFHRESGEISVFAIKRVVDEIEDPDLEITLEDARRLDPEANLESLVEIPKPTAELGRIAAQAAKQVLYQKVREAERENVFREFSERIGEIVNGIVKRFERGDIIVDLGRTEAVLPKKEQSRAEHYNQGDRVRAVIVNVDRATKGPQVILSRTDPLLLKRLFEMEVPEIYDNTVMIESVARDPGDRAKVAVLSKDRDVDPVGACVGIKGSRVQSIIRELRGEKIDIVQYSEDPQTFVANALNPAKISRVAIADEENKVLEVMVEDGQLSQAIGKKGQNVRLASRLIGWRIDIKSESDKKAEVEAAMRRMTRTPADLVAELEGLDEAVAALLFQADYRLPEELAAAGVEGLTALEGLDEPTAAGVLEAAGAYLAEQERLRAEEEARLKAEEEAAIAAMAAEADEDSGEGESLLSDLGAGTPETTEEAQEPSGDTETSATETAGAAEGGGESKAPNEGR
ncbi:MAG: transcription termination factor NusA [Acidobacteriota bacterium]|jgi:N utilization substance protein A